MQAKTKEKRERLKINFDINSNVIFRIFSSDFYSILLRARSNLKINNNKIMHVVPAAVVDEANEST
jgi:hypothetical protein